MARRLPRIALALAGSGVLFVMQVNAAELCMEWLQKEISLTLCLITLLWWWWALGCAVLFAVDTNTHEAESDASAVFRASESATVSALQGLAFELAFCEHYVVKVLSKFLAMCFLFTVLATAVALVWRAWRGE